jgi:hypothetical protein
MEGRLEQKGRSDHLLVLHGFPGLVQRLLEKGTSELLVNCQQETLREVRARGADAWFAVVMKIARIADFRTRFGRFDGITGV